MTRDAFLQMVSRAVLAVALAVLACCALGPLSPAARADGDPGSDVLVYQNLFVAADANVSVAQQVGLGELLTAASRDGFTIRVAIVARPADLGAITQLWGKPASYASFLAVELSLAYSQRLLVVMPDGFGFNWHGHSAGAAYRVLGKIADRARRQRPGRLGRDGRAGARRRLGRPARPARGRAVSRSHGRRRGRQRQRQRRGRGVVAVRRPPGGDRPRVRSPGLADRRHRRRGAGRDRARRLARPARRAPASGAACDGATTAGSIEGAVPSVAATRRPRHLARGRLGRHRGRADRRAHGAHPGGRRGAERQRGGDGRGPGGQPRPRPGDVAVQPSRPASP